MSFLFKKQLVAAGITLTVLSTQVAASELQSVQQAQLAPMSQVSLPDVNGGVASLSDFKGKVVLVDFWASWCGPCRQSFPWMNQLQDTYRAEGLEVVAINLDQEAELAKAFLQDVPAQFTVLLDTDAQLPDEYGVMGMPSSYLIDRNGKIRAQHIGFHSDRVKDYEDSIKALLAE
ncbi:TlpA family protein disulfide reductase [Oceanospirillum sp.]|uniref:TlpA family protein disulfide reductase n=1 Tax=Oceanospirillum sp. TaxID=2021254 RepID=UPI003A8D4C03